MFDYLALTACSVGTAREPVFAAVGRPVFVCSLCVPVFSFYFIFHWEFVGKCYGSDEMHFDTLPLVVDSNAF